MATIGAIPSPPPKWNDEIFECNSISNSKVTVAKEPTENTLFVFLNGQYLTKGSSYDYMINGQEITFNTNVLTTDGHVSIKYSYI